MRSTVITTELMQRNLQRLASESALSLRSLAGLAKIPYGDLEAKLASSDCHFTVRELANITLALGYKIEAVFEECAEMRPCPNSSCVETEHEWANGEQFNPCRLKSIESEGSVVHGHLLESGWVAWADADDLEDGHEGVVQAKALSEAFETMQAECDRLNGHELYRSTAPGVPAFEGAL